MIQQSYSWVYMGEKNKTNLKRCMYSNVHNSTTYNSQGMAAA